MVNRIISFFKEARLELGRVTWPTRAETINYTAAVIVVSGVVALLLGGLDFVFQYILNRFLL